MKLIGRILIGIICGVVIVLIEGALVAFANVSAEMGAVVWGIGLLVAISVPIVLTVEAKKSKQADTEE